MEFNDFYERYIDKYRDIRYHYDNSYGYIVWRIGTGENIELLHIKTFEKRKGYGKKLFIEMLRQICLSDIKPYYSIFGFTRSSNKEAQNFYSAIGFNIVDICGLYKDGNCKLFWSSFEDLLKKHDIEYTGE